MILLMPYHCFTLGKNKSDLTWLDHVIPQHLQYSMKLILRTFIEQQQCSQHYFIALAMFKCKCLNSNVLHDSGWQQAPFFVKQIWWILLFKWCSHIMCYFRVAWIMIKYMYAKIFRFTLTRVFLPEPELFYIWLHFIEEIVQLDIVLTCFNTLIYSY